jgi:hypothetical protein
MKYVLKQDQIAQFSGFYPKAPTDELIIGQPNSIKITVSAV